MNNQINEIRRSIKLLRASIQEAESAVQVLLAEGGACSELSQTLLEMRGRLAKLCREKTALGDKSEIALPTKPAAQPKPVSLQSRPFKRKLFARG